MENQIFDAQMERLKLVIRKHTATDLADFFGVPQSAVSAAVRRGKMPSSWLVILMRVKNVHPEWILTGKGPCLMTLRPEPSRYETDVEVTTRKADEEALRRLPSHMLAEELVRRIAVSQGARFLFGVPRQPALAHCPLSNPMPQQKKAGSPPPAFSPRTEQTRTNTSDQCSRDRNPYPLH